MSSLQVRDLPEPLYRKLSELAEKEHRSLAQQAVITLAKGLSMSLGAKERRHQIISELIASSKDFSDYELPSATKLIREDRDR